MAALRRVGAHLETTATRLDAMRAFDERYRFRPWSMRGDVHRELAAAGDAARAADLLMRSIASEAPDGFADASLAVAQLRWRLQPNFGTSMPNVVDRNWERRDMIRSAARDARAWGRIITEAADQLDRDPRDLRSEAIERAIAVTSGRSTDLVSDLLRLAAIEQLPDGAALGMPHHLARGVAAGLDAYGGPELAATNALGSWARRTQLLDRPGFDRAAAIDELDRALASGDPDEALRVVAAIDQLPGNIRPDLPHARLDWNWTTAQEYRNGGRHQLEVDALAARVDDLRTAAALPPAPDSTLEAVNAVVGRAGSSVDAEQLRALADLPGFPPTLVHHEPNHLTFDIVRTRVWADSQALARIPGATRESMVGAVQEAISVLARGDGGIGGDLGAGATLAAHLEGRYGGLVPARGHDALARIAAVDALPEHLRPDLPPLVGIGSWLDIASHQSTRATDHASDLQRVRDWAIAQEQHVLPDAQGERSALRRFLDPKVDDGTGPELTRTQQATVVGEVLDHAEQYTPRELSGALDAARRYLAAADSTDPAVREIVDTVTELADRNIERAKGDRVDGLRYHPDYAELGRVSAGVRLVDRLEAAAPRLGDDELHW